MILAILADWGIGATTGERAKDFFDKMMKAGSSTPTLLQKAYNLKFVNKGVGLKLRRK